MTFHDVSEYSTTYVTQLISKYMYCQKICYLRYFPTLLCTEFVFIFLLESILVFCVVCYFFQFWSFCFLFSESILFFHDFPWPTLQFHAFPGLENEIIKSYHFPCFPWPVRTQMTCLSLFQFFPLTKALFLAAKSKYYNFYLDVTLDRQLKVWWWLLTFFGQDWYSHQVIQHSSVAIILALWKKTTTKANKNKR